MTEPSLYTSAVRAGGDPAPEPSTALTASVESVDIDRASLMFDAGVVR